MDFDLESLVHLEQTFYDFGYQDGLEHGRIHGLIEGRALGREKGFEMWEELGFYEGFAKTWRAIYVKQGKEDSRAGNHIRHLLDLISQFPKQNPSSSDSSSSLDISRLLRQIRSRYKALCSTLGAAASLRAADSADDSVEQPATRKPFVWPLEAPTQQDLSF
ncbi:DUF1715-domain-containing protein [Guyanagaster necrorhizus]|uniref:DUF1715-domain-containing protein n=1 Tax=Guyanagaster necrorhizus TaxID=856835 RepID=A0A9P7W486_9AGAR|nr:DUF1715-domain-containing protein [Guyanagaster necrorhizus MCA 3950]KAG7451872.1 DUF1715-domain-containing protein [Guyanagaster necrorhizus MCA 3950]